MVKTRKNYKLSSTAIRALKELIQKGYSFPASTETAAVERAIREAWEKEFPGKPYPIEGEKGRDP